MYIYIYYIHSWPFWFKVFAHNNKIHNWVFTCIRCKAMKKHDVMYIHFTTALFKVVKAHRPRDPSPDGQTSGRENQR